MTTEELAAWRAKAEAVVQTLLAGDWSGPVYIVFDSELPPPRPACWGLTGHGLDVARRDAIGARWRGRGLAVLLSADLPGEPALWATLLHELAHIMSDNLFPHPGGDSLKAQFAMLSMADAAAELASID
jgi:hypothetical protein